MAARGEGVELQKTETHSSVTRDRRHEDDGRCSSELDAEHGQQMQMKRERKKKNRNEFGQGGK